MRSAAGLFVLLTCVVIGLAIRPGAQGQPPPAQGQPAVGPAQGQPPGGPPGAPGAPGQGRAAPPPPQNLKVLPKNWTRMQVQALMQTFVTSLGQTPPAPGSPPPPQGQGEGCLHCHARAAGAPAAAPGAAAPPAAAPPAVAPPAGAAPAAGAPPQGGRGPQIDYASDANPNKDIARKMIELVMASNDGFLKDLGDKAVPEKVSCWTCHRGDATMKPPMMPPNGWGRGGFSLLPAGPPMPPGRGGGQD
jgi:hypothetical protein